MARTLLSFIFSTLPSAKRIDALTQRMSRTRTALANPRYSGSALAADLDEQIELFTRDTTTGVLRDLPAAAG